MLPDGKACKSFTQLDVTMYIKLSAGTTTGIQALEHKINNKWI
jgi:hypothetical protein